MYLCLKFTVSIESLQLRRSQHGGGKKEDNLFLYIIMYGVTIIFLKFPTAIFLVTRPYMVSRTHTYNTIVQINLVAE